MCILTHRRNGLLLVLVDGLQPTKERHPVSRLALQLPVADELGDELRLFVEGNPVDDAVEPGRQVCKGREKEM